MSIPTAQQVIKGWIKKKKKDAMESQKQRKKGKSGGNDFRPIGLKPFVLVVFFSKKRKLEFLKRWAIFFVCLFVCLFFPYFSHLMFSHLPPAFCEIILKYSPISSAAC